jgi:hypothetical protein
MARVRACTAHPDDAEDVDVEHLVPLVVGVGLDGAGGADAGVVDHDVEPAQPLGGLADRRADRGVVAHVGADLLQRGLEGGRGQVEAGHPGAAGGQEAGGGQADAGGAAGDQRPQAGELGVAHGTATFRSGPSGYAEGQEALDSGRGGGQKVSRVARRRPSTSNSRSRP